MDTLGNVPETRRTFTLLVGKSSRDDITAKANPESLGFDA
jgi:hypothetical protein